MNKNDILPAGTIVKVRLSNELYMIVAHKVFKKESKGLLLYDYCAVRYPFGFEGFNEMIVINNDFIKYVLHMGYKDEEFEDYCKVIKSKIKRKGE